MPRLTIDDIAIDVPAGSSVLEAALAAGVPVPHFCWHPALGKAGACRVCAVAVLEGPVKGVQMSCMLPVQEGMVVDSRDPRAVALRRQVLEWLMLNHPHDCPVCDEGGECRLQDYTIAAGQSQRRFAGQKRTHVNQELGPHIQHEMNRCIQCYRCVRFYQEYAGGDDFGVLGSAGRVYFGRFGDGPLASPFAGNLADLCPTGALTDRSARYRARYWDYQMAPSLCQECSLGCNTIPAAHYRELHKIMARPNPALNGWFLCDRGRFGNRGGDDPRRPRTPLLAGEECHRDTALAALLAELRQVIARCGADSVALVGSPRLPLEGLLLLAPLATALGAAPPCYFTTRQEAQNAASALQAQQRCGDASMAQLRAADCVVILGGTPLAEAPLLALAIRQAWRAGATVYRLGGEAGDAPLPAPWQEVASLADVPLASAQRPVAVASAQSTPAPLLAAAADLSLPLVCLHEGPNGRGAAMLAAAQAAPSLEERLATGQVRALLAVEAAIPPALLTGLELVAALDWQPTPTMAAARLFLPTTTCLEMAGTCINYEGRAQRFAQVHEPGVPLRQLAGDGTRQPPAALPDHPCHTHRATPPGGEPRPAWQLLAELLRQLGQEVATPFTGPWQELQQLDPEGDGVCLAGPPAAAGGA